MADLLAINSIDRYGFNFKTKLGSADEYFGFSLVFSSLQIQPFQKIALDQAEAALAIRNILLYN